MARRQTWTASEIEPIAFRSDPPQPQLLTPPPVRGLGTADFDVVYQPIVDLRNGRFFAHEALVRCKIEALKSPLVLFEQAVNERACGRLGRTIREVSFARCPGVPLFVNIHPDELGARWLVRPDDPVFFHDNSVFLEITESAAFTHFDLCCDVLREVCSRSGAHLVVDDLGAGYSNLKRIIDLEPKVIKLDRSLIAGLDRRPRQRVLFTSVVKLCADLGARVVAEGIETIDEFKAARDCGAQYGQGYLLARPGYPPPAVTFPSV